MTAFNEPTMGPESTGRKFQDDPTSQILTSTIWLQFEITVVIWMCHIVCHLNQLPLWLPTLCKELTNAVRTMCSLTVGQSLRGRCTSWVTCWPTRKASWTPSWSCLLLATTVGTTVTLLMKWDNWWVEHITLLLIFLFILLSYVIPIEWHKQNLHVLCLWYENFIILLLYYLINFADYLRQPAQFISYVFGIIWLYTP